MTVLVGCGSVRYMCAQIVDQLFSKKVPEQIRGMLMLRKVAGEDAVRQQLVLVLDLVFKWCSLRLCWQPHVKALLELQTLMEALFGAVEEEQHMLSECVAAASLPQAAKKVSEEIRLPNQRDRSWPLLWGTGQWSSAATHVQQKGRRQRFGPSACSPSSSPSRLSNPLELAAGTRRASCCRF